MHAAAFQNDKIVYVLCDKTELKQLPEPIYITDMQSGLFLAEFNRDIETIIALRLNGLTISPSA